ncbi:MAG: response regulator [Pseudomonadales bacterium]|nr:response regulator [Pseudomonadales bacterium]
MSIEEYTLESTQHPPPTVLFVDDEPAILSALKRLTKRRDWNVLIADSGFAALTVLREIHVDLIVSDMKMPVMSGPEFLGHAYEKYPDIRKLVLTGHSDMRMTVQAINEGHIFGFINKPWDNRDLLETLEFHLDDRDIVENKVKWTSTKKKNGAKPSLKNIGERIIVNSSDLVPGMILSRDLKTAAGTLLLPKGSQLSHRYINAFIEQNNNFDNTFTLYVVDNNETPIETEDMGLISVGK